jgi:ubiquinone/menaquinone biosynthesis C-methylase UbiE
MNFAKNYYESEYSKIQRGGIQGWGNSINDYYVEKNLNLEPNSKVLEIGASSGEHFKFVKDESKFKEYIALDIYPRITNPDLAIKLEKKDFYRFVEADASAIPFPDNYFDAVISTCVLAHVENPEAVFAEIKRVVKPSGQIVIGMPTDPGILNRFIKKVITYRTMKKQGIQDPKLNYAREHINSVDKLIVFAEHIFKNDTLKLKFFPFGINSWNLNLLVIIKVKKES